MLNLRTFNHMCSNSAISENQELSPEFYFSTIADHSIGIGLFDLLTSLMSLQLIRGFQGLHSQCILEASLC